ncbi:MAG: hypothetical protein OXI40_18155 [Chloroflexota bacterium]|nr:hypothetical protein [Chloroflexota bacterium]
MPSSISLFETRLNPRLRPRSGLRLLILSLFFIAFAMTAPAQDAPTVTITPDSGPVESALLMILIEGLQPNAAYSIEFLFDGEIVFSSEETSDDQGRITFPAGSTEGDLPGIYTVQVVQDGAALASADFELTAKEAVIELPGEVTVTPSSGPIGTLHAIKIAELDAQRRYTVEITASESQRVAYRRVRFSDMDGIIEIEVFAEEGDSPGQQAIAIYDSEGETIAEGEFTINAPPERDVAVIVTPAITEAGSAVEISVSGLSAFDSVSAQVKSDDGVLIDAVMARASRDGEVNLSFTGPEDMAEGRYDIEVLAEGDQVATATLTIGELADTELALAAVVSVTPPSAAIGSEHLIEVSGLQPGQDYRLKILDPDGVEEYATARTADAAGAFNLRISSTPEDDIGFYTVEIRDDAGEVLLASAALEISFDADADEGGSDALATIEPQSAFIGSSHVILVSNLTPGERVNFDVTFAGKSVYTSNKTADSAGMVRLELLTDAGDAPGDYLITAMREAGNQPTVVLTATAGEAPAPATIVSMGAGDVIEGSLVEGRAEIKFEGEGGQYMRIAVRSDDFDPAAALFDRDKAEIAFNDDSRGRKSAVIGPLRMPYSGAYILEIFPSPSLADLASIQGDFVLSIDPVGVDSIEDVDAVPFSLSASIPAAYYELSVKTGDSLTLAVDSNGNLDTTLQVLSSDGIELAFDDDSGPGFEAEISNLIFDRDDTYVLAVSTFDELAAGSGTITVSRNPARALEDDEVIITLNDKVIRDLVVFHAAEGESLILNLEVLSGAVEDLFVSATVDGMEVMSYSAMGVPDRLPLAFVMPTSGQVVVALEKFGFDDRISLAVSLERQ